MRNIRVLACVVAMISMAAAQTQSAPQKGKRSGASSSAQSTSAAPASRGTSARSSAPSSNAQQQTPDPTASAIQQATNPYYGSTMSANPQANACGSGGPNDNLATCRQQMAQLNRQRATLVAQQRGTQQQIASLQASGNAAYDNQVSQLQTRLGNLTQQIASLDARLASTRDRIAQFGGQPSSNAAGKNH